MHTVSHSFAESHSANGIESGLTAMMVTDTNVGDSS